MAVEGAGYARMTGDVAQCGWCNLHLKLEAVAIEVGSSHCKTQESIKAEISENDEDRKYKHKEELSREYSLSGHG